jgi:hypothetical protein
MNDDRKHQTLPRRARPSMGHQCPGKHGGPARIQTMRRPESQPHHVIAAESGHAAPQELRPCVVLHRVAVDYLGVFLASVTHRIRR